MENSTIICECNKVTYEEIKKAADSGCMDVTCIMLKTEAGNACGQCKSMADDPKAMRRYHVKEDVLEG